MTNKIQITPGRKQMLLYLAQRNDWGFVADVFKDVEPDGITTLTGARKALNELEYVEMDNVGTPVRPTYQCRLKSRLDTLEKLKNAFNDQDSLHKFMKSSFYIGMIPELIDRFNNSMPPLYGEDPNSEFYKQCTNDELEDHLKEMCNMCNMSVAEFFGVQSNFDIMCAIAMRDDHLLIAQKDTDPPIDDKEWRNAIRHDLQKTLEEGNICFFAYYRLLDKDKECLATSLKDNLLTLKFILYFISATATERRRMIIQLRRDAIDPTILPSAAHKNGQKDTTRKLKELADELPDEYDYDPKSLFVDWIELFNLLDHLNSKYWFLFE